MTTNAGDGSPSPVCMSDATSPLDIATVRDLFCEYAADIGIDLAFQGFEEELASLPGDYAAPSGRLCIARIDGDVAGCVALRRIDDAVCEMKRMYVRPAHRGRGVGRMLAVHIIDQARRAGYLRMRLDTLASMTAALAIYRALGFRTIPPYRYNPLPDAVYMEADLSAPVDVDLPAPQS